MSSFYSYIHIPFCKKRCKYCRFASFGVLNGKKINEYVNFLVKEIEESKILSKTGFNQNKQKHSLKSIYFGGGTPSILNLKQLREIFLALKNSYNFDNDIEITLETTPNKITKTNLIGWQKLGINRLSLGIQTLNEKSLKEIGRENKGDIFKSLDAIKTTTPDNLNISLDFIIGLPYVKSGEIKENIETILNKYTFVTSISVYMLEDQYYPDNWNNVGIKEEDYLGEYIEIKNFLNSRGIFSYEISNFAKAGFECKHNKAYWNHSNVLAFGLGSHGFLKPYRYENYNEFESYYKNSIKNIEKLNKNDIFLEKVMFQLRTVGLEKDIYKKLNKEKITEFLKKGYLKLENNFLKLEDKGVLIIDYILREII